MSPPSAPQRDGSALGRLVALLESFAIMVSEEYRVECLVVLTCDEQRRIPLLISEALHFPSLLAYLKDRGSIRADVTEIELEMADNADAHQLVKHDWDDDSSIAFSGDTRHDHTRMLFRTVGGMTSWDDCEAVARHILSITNGRLPTVRPFDFHVDPFAGTVKRIGDVFAEVDGEWMSDYEIATLQLHYLDPSHPLLLYKDARMAMNPHWTPWQDCLDEVMAKDDDVAMKEVAQVFTALQDASRADSAARTIQRFWRRFRRTCAACVMQRAIRHVLYSPPTGALYVKTADHWHARIGA